jgi:SAM-dependent methyltransferase
MTGTANAAQAEYWNSQPGKNWVTYQSDMDLLLAATTDCLLAAGQPRAGENLLDVGCGAGDSTFALASAVAPGGRVLGVDISTPLVERARARQGELAMGNAAFLVADAQDHRFEPSACDMIASRFGVMFFSDPVAAFRNLAGALRKGGRIVFVGWAAADVNPWFSVPSRAIAARLGAAPPPPAGAPGPLAFADGQRVLGILSQAGFSEAACSTQDVDLHHPGGMEAVLRIAPHMGPIARRLREANGTAADREAIMEAIAADFERFLASDGIRVPARVHVFSAVRN